MYNLAYTLFIAIPKDRDQIAQINVCFWIYSRPLSFYFFLILVYFYSIRPLIGRDTTI